MAPLGRSSFWKTSRYTMSFVYDDSASSCSFSLPALPSPTEPPSASLPPVPFVFYGDESILRTSPSSALVLETYLKYTQLARMVCGHKSMKPRKVAAGGFLFQATMEVEDEDDNASVANEHDTTTFLSELFLQYTLVVLQDAVAEAESLAQEEEAFWKAMDMNIDAVVRARDKERRKEMQETTVKKEMDDEAQAPSSLSSSSSSSSSSTSLSSCIPILSSGAVPRKHSASALRPLQIWLLESIPSSYTSSSPPSLDLVFPSSSSSTTIALSRASGLTPAQITTFFENYRYKHLSPLLAGTRKPASFYEVVLAFKMNLPLTNWLMGGGKRKRAGGREEGATEETRGKKAAPTQQQPQRQQRRKKTKKGKTKKKKKKEEDEEEDTDEEEMEELQEGRKEGGKEEGFYRRISLRCRTPLAPLVGDFLYGKEAEEEEEELEEEK